MALTEGTNCGFCAAAPSGGNPEIGYTGTLDNYGYASKFTSPATAETVTEIGWYCVNATQEANFEVAIYDHASGTDLPDSIVGSKSDTNAKGTGAGWKAVTGLNITIDPSTIYWIAVQLDNTATATSYTRRSNGSYRVSLKSESTLPDPWERVAEIDYLQSFYAVWEAGTPPEPTFTSINIGDEWKTVSGANVIKINIGDTWKSVAATKINISDAWKAVTIS